MESFTTGTGTAADETKVVGGGEKIGSPAEAGRGGSAGSGWGGVLSPDSAQAHWPASQHAQCGFNFAEQSCPVAAAVQEVLSKIRAHPVPGKARQSRRRMASRFFTRAV
jgi:hypothetical protein